MQVTSSVSFKVIGCVKNLIVIAGGVLQGDSLTPVQLIGYFVSVAGFLLFSVSKQSVKKD